MEHLKEDQILLYEELCAKPVRRGERLTEVTILFRKNINLAYYVANKYPISRDGVIDRDDIVQTAFEGLWKACLNYDSDRGFEFSTYAVPMITGYILKALRDNQQLHFPKYFKDMRSCLRDHNFTLPLSDYEISVLVEEGKFSRKQIMEYAEPEVMSFDNPTSDYDGSDITLTEVIPDLSSTIYQDSLSEDDLEKAIDKILKYIKSSRRDIVEEWMYATLAGEHITQDELSKKYNVSKQYISLLLKSAISIVKMHEEEIKDLFGY